MMNPNINSNCCEPIELRALKQRLANLTCTCKTYKNNSRYWKIGNQVEQGIQVKKSNSSSDQFVQTTSGNKIRDDRHIEIVPQQQSVKIDYLRNNFVLCPTCLVALNALHKGSTRVLKDEELETNSKMFTCDKSIGRNFKYIDKTTSVTGKPEPGYSNLTFYDTISDCSSDTLKCSRNKRENNHEKVTFIDDNLEYQQNKKNQALKGNCSRMNNFIDSIRPPLINMF
ncbi:uncharacterized protein LOC113509883 [Galleria mellonella]|uniref:Uncharacterized protein LOC113509883 n=1 Tax=Galleria mellonella TaxID=7137 RepID=A0A6J1W8A5_GALME|nr:uncharacterized protein LOC113509883 [Galleria mellonella]